MAYNRLLLEKWLAGPDWGDFLSKNNALAKNVSTERFKLLEKRYFTELKEKINYCLEILESDKDPLVYYTLACLYNKSNLDESREYLYKRPVRLYCIKAIRANRQYAEAWVLLSCAYSWVSFIGDNKDLDDGVIISMWQENLLINHTDKKKTFRYIEKAIYCIKRAIVIDQKNNDYQQLLKRYYFERNEEYGK